MSSILLLCIILILLLEKETTNSLRLLKLVVPTVKYRGENALLECQYELNNRSVNHRQQQQYYQSAGNKNNNNNNKNSGFESSNSHYNYRRNNYLYYDNDEDMDEILYSVKWYKDETEFYRFIPRASVPQNSYSFDGIKVDHKRSNSHKVFLRNVSLKSSGIYKCEVSLEGPSFSSVQASEYMLVVYLPNSGPFIQGEEQAYQSGDKLNLNCTSARSHPPSKLQFFINDNPITNPKYIIHYHETHHNHGLITTSIGLDMRILPQYFEQNAMRIKCVATISPVIWSGNKETIIQQQGLQQFDIPLPSIDTREAMFLVKSSAITIKSMTQFIITLLLLLKFTYR
ncbi:hypothetical protein PVAND_000005 [Polypedilum vanderplanki]|uniref:Ig-like domain-containing protein n=1 Tax=Polypedilum vanderplanki TaxID=319348 RepID=A0A9J6BIR5_POLVA|nr:hypothetical protein PVAND_000005 [Polypedilum vanderplanki]